MFPEAHIQMVSSVINPKGSARDGFSRSDEYIFFVMFGECTPARLSLSNEWSSSAIVSAQEKADDDKAEKSVEPGWTSMMRRGTDSMRTDSPNLYYPIYVDPTTRTIKEIGTSIPMGQDRAEEIPDLIQVLPLRRNGTQGRWQVGNIELKNRIQQGRVRLGRPTAYGFVINYLPDGEYAKVVKGEYTIQGYADDGSMIAYKKELGVDELRMPPTQWKIASHNASENDTTLLTSVIGEKRFPFPKSLYAVRDTLRFFVADKPNALIVDFFAGSGTTLHAVNLLNAEYGGDRRCIMVTNNEVSDDEAKALKKQDIQPGDEEWEKLGIARYVTWPRTVCSIEGHDVNGNPLKGEYLGTDISMSNGFAANAEYFKLGFLDKSSVALGQQFREILPMLWLKAGAVGKRPVLADGELPDMLIPESSNFAVLIDERYFGAFLADIEARPDIEYVYLVTNSEDAYREMGARIRTRNVTQLYRDYIDNFVINSRRI